MKIMRGLTFLLVCAAMLGGAPAWAETIDTGFIEQPWPKQRLRETEVGRYPVLWRERASKPDGIFAGVRFTAPLARPEVWKLSNEYEDIGQMTPGVTAVRYRERTERREVIDVDVKILWKTLTLTFEVEKDPPAAVRFRLVNQALGEYRGVSKFDETADGTVVELLTWLKPNRPVPMRLLLVFERMGMLSAAREFLERCEARQRSGPPPAH